MKKLRHHLVFVALLLPLGTAVADDKPVSGLYYSRRVEASPRFNAKGMAWWNDRLIIMNREPPMIHRFTPPDQFEVLKMEGLTNPFGAAVDPEGRLLFTENKDKVLYRLARIDRDGKEETLLKETGVNHRNKRPEAGLCTPLMLAVHPNGTIYWSGYPTTGTRYLLSGPGEFGLEDVQVASPHVGHSYGIGLSPEHDWLYVSSQLPLGSKGRGITRFPVNKDGRLGKGELHIDIDTFSTTHFKNLPPAKDGSDRLTGWLGRLHGLAVDRLGYIYVGGSHQHKSGAAIAVFSPDGENLVAMIVDDPEEGMDLPTNLYGLAFGGKDGRTLFMSGKGTYPLYQVQLPVAGEVVSRKR